MMLSVCVLIEMDTNDSEAQNVESCSTEEVDPTAERMPAFGDGPFDNLDCTETKDNDSASVQYVDHHSSLDEASGDTVNAAEDMVECCQYDVVDAVETESSHDYNEHVPDDCVKHSEFDESCVSDGSRLDDNFESGQVQESQPDKVPKGDNDWMYVLGHDQLKKKACIVHV